MNQALKQFIDLYNEHHDEINNNSPQMLNNARNAALRALTSHPLPKKGSEGYEATSLEAFLDVDYGVNIKRVDFNVDPKTAFRCDVPNLSTCMFFFFNDMFHPLRIAQAQLPQGVIAQSMRQCAIQNPHILEQYYGTVAKDHNTIVDLNTLLAQDGMVIYVPDGVTVEKPIQIVNIINSGAPIMAVRRLLVVIGRNAKASILMCDHNQSREATSLCLQVNEIIAQDGANVDFYDLEENSSSAKRLSATYVEQQHDSNVLINGITLTNGLTRNNFSINVNGEGATTQLLGMTIASGNQHVDNNTLISHNAPHCNSNEMFKYVLNDTAVGAFAGKILVSEDCPKVEAYQGNHNICASTQSKMYSKPQLEIYTDDVKCSHGTTVGQLDQDALMYMRTRGIGVETARTMLMQAFMADVVEAVRLAPLRDRLRHLVEKRFNGSLAMCNDCVTKLNNQCNKI
ncbi:MAG: Fe-S cluster assembly protein SufD [Muribaculaceae bacterium]|nr:Fe-S cluster assembly protein SufD [Muribaculaceae bacterium]